MLYERIPQLVDAEQLETNFEAEIYHSDGETVFFEGVAGDYVIRDTEDGHILGILDEETFNNMYSMCCDENCGDCSNEDCENWECHCESCNDTFLSQFVEPDSPIIQDSGVTCNKLTVKELEVEGLPSYADLVKMVEALKPPAPVTPTYTFPTITYPNSPYWTNPFYPNLNPVWCDSSRTYTTGTLVIK